MIPNEIKEKLKKYRKVFVQFPEGLKNKILEIKKELEDLGLEVILDAEPTYGFCDLKDDVALGFDCDCIFHIGHNSFGFEFLLKKSKVPVIIWEYKLKPDLDRLYRILEKYLNILEENEPIGLVASLQYLGYIEPIKEYLEKYKIKVVVPKNPQILGCNVSNAKSIESKVESFLIPTSGIFYPLGLLLEVEKPLLSLNLETEKIEDLLDLKLKYLKIIYWNLKRFEEARRIGLLVSWKVGQRFWDPFKVGKVLKKLGKEFIILAMDEIDQSKLYGIDCDFYLNLACPRIFDGYERFEKPILNFEHLLKFNKKVYEIWKEVNSWK